MANLNQLYPDQTPAFTLLEAKNLSDEHLKLLSKALGEQAKAKLGAPMVYEVSRLLIYIFK